MKYILIYWFLFVLITSKKEFQENFTQKKTIFLESFASEENESECQSNTKEGCINKPNPEDNKVCCFYERKINGRTIKSGCESTKLEMITHQDLFKMQEFETYVKEIRGYGMYVEKSESHYKSDAIKYTCKDNEISTTFHNDYTDQDIETLKSRKHCLYINENERRIDDDDETLKCEDYLVLDSSKNIGIECGYRKYNVKLSAKEDKKNTSELIVQTCDLFNLKLYSKLCQVYKKKLFDINQVKKYVNTTMYNIESFTSEIYNKKEEKITYDSETDKFHTTDKNSGFMLFMSEYLFLLFLILF